MKRVKAVLAKVLEIDEDLITDDTSPENVESWDSFNALLLISEFEKAFNMHFKIDEVMSVKCVRDIKEILRKHGVEIKDEKNRTL